MNTIKNLYCSFTHIDCKVMAKYNLIAWKWGLVHYNLQTWTFLFNWMPGGFKNAVELLTIIIIESMIICYAKQLSCI